MCRLAEISSVLADTLSQSYTEPARSWPNNQVHDLPSPSGFRSLVNAMHTALSKMAKNKLRLTCTES